MRGEKQGQPNMAEKPDSFKLPKKKIGLGIAGAALAAWLFSPGSTPEKPSMDPVDPPKTHNSKFNDTPQGEKIHDRDEPSPFISLNVPKYEPAPILKPQLHDTETPKTIPPELQDSMDVLQSRCNEFLEGDAMTVIDPFNQPTIISQIDTYFASIISNDNWRQKYPKIANKAYLTDLCGGSDRFTKRTRELAKLILSQTSWSKTKKAEAINWCIQSTTLIPNSNEIVELLDVLHSNA
ncbi:MAG: hypothetical protein Q7S24_01840, partial [bacterium]|nr:hypothetical protein [bacterium]